MASRVLRMRGLPFTATDQDITQFFSPFVLEDIKICKKSGRPTGEAYVRFGTEKLCSDVLQGRDKEKLGKRYIELFRAKDQDLENSTQPAVKGTAAAGHGLRMRGLPFSACVADVVSFFEGVPGVDTESILFVYDSSGRPSGEAYVYFTAADACAAALRMDKKEMGSRYIELFAIQEADVQRAARMGRLRPGKADPGKGESGAKESGRGSGGASAAGATAASGAGKGRERSSAGRSPKAEALVAAPSNPRPIPNYKPVVMRQLTKTFANVAASPPVALGPAVPSARAGAASSGAADATTPASLDALSVNDPTTSSASTSCPASGAPGGQGAAPGTPGRNGEGGMPGSAPGAGSGKFGADRGVGGEWGGGSRPQAEPREPQQQHGHDPNMQHAHEGQAWHQWGMPSFGLGNVGVYDMWSNSMVPKLSPHPMDGHNGLWQAPYPHGPPTYNNVNGLSTAEVVYGAHAQPDQRAFHH